MAAGAQYFFFLGGGGRQTNLTPAWETDGKATIHMGEKIPPSRLLTKIGIDFDHKFHH